MSKVVKKKYNLKTTKKIIKRMRSVRKIKFRMRFKTIKRKIKMMKSVKKK